MAAIEGNLRDITLDAASFPPGQNSFIDIETTPVHEAGSFSLARNQLFDSSEPTSHLIYLEHPLYAKYMRLPKGLISPHRASVLEEVHEGLAAERASRFLFAGGWAAAEAAIVMRGARHKRLRDRLVEGAADTWLRAHDRVSAIQQAGEETDDHYCLKERIELALASVPLLEGMVAGDVRVSTLSEVAKSYAQIGRENDAFGRSKRDAGDEKRAVFHKGLSYEILALLGLNEELTTRRFAMPATARNDSGYYLPKLTHDLMIVRQRAGQIKSMLPAEIKSKMSKQDRKRYKALIIDGNILDVIGAGEPGPMLDLLARVYEEDASGQDFSIAACMSRQLWEMTAQYSAGNVLKTGSGDSVIQFHDASKVRLGSYALYATAA